MNYKKLVFAVVKPPSRVLGYHIVKNGKEYTDLVTKAVDGGNLIYYSEIIKRTSSSYQVEQPWVLDRLSISDKEPDVESKPVSKPEVKPTSEPEVQLSDGIFCPYCNIKMSSTSGRTLHVKTKHPDKMKEYKVWLSGEKSKKKHSIK